MNGHLYCDDSKFSLANILPEEGSQLGYMYDLGDHWSHELTVESILPESESNGRVELLDRHGACPAEDHQGNYNWAEIMPKILSGDLKTHEEIKRSFNYKSDPKAQRSGWRLDPATFDVGAARRRIRDALQSKASIPSGAKKNVFVPGMMGGGLDSKMDETTLNNRLFGGMEGRQIRGTKRVAQNYTDFPGSFLTETVREKADRKGAALCENCGKPDGLKRCSGCAGVWYCSKEYESHDHHNAVN